MKKWFNYFVLGIFFIYSAPRLSAQVKIMPVGDSITWGKINMQPPPGDSEGYRKPLHEKLVAAGLSVQFVGEPGMGSPQNLGYFRDGTKIGDFISADSLMGDITDKMALYQPDIVVLHIGTNDVGSGVPIGDYATNNSVIYKLYTLVGKITNASSVDHLLLCKIIPKYSTPGQEIETVDFNNAVEIMLNQLPPVQRAKVTLVDMWTPFYANKFKYYNYDVDKVHPSADGYTAMATIFTEYIAQALKPSFVDEFDRVALGPDWVVSPGIEIVNKGENGGGALRFTATGYDQWDDLAIWKTSKGLSTCSIKMHMDSTPADLDKVGVAIGLDAESTTANGYLVWIYNGFVRVKVITGGNANVGQDVNQFEMNPLQPGDVLKVSYRKSSEANYFTIQVNNNVPITLRDVHKYAGNGDNLYAGIMFRRSAGAAYNCLADNFSVQSQLPDVIPPGKIYNFSFEDATNTSLAFSWSAVGNDEYVGQAASYDLRYSTSPIIDETTFAKATIVTGLSQPQEAGTREYFRFSGLQSGTSYYFVIRAVDSWGNKGYLSDQLYARTNASGEVVEDFNRPTEPNGTIGPDWVIDGNQYRIDYNSTTQEGEFVNYQNDGSWGSVGVYRARTNPSIVKMVWGRQATLEGIGQGGLALMLTNPSINTDGYLIWVRTQSKVIYLYEIDNGEVVPPPAGSIDGVPYTLKDENGNLRLPVKGDTMSVILDWTYPSGHRFDVFINGKRASDRSLFDPNKKYNSLVKYSGLMLGRLGRTNNVTAFITSAEYTGPSRILKYAGHGQVGQVATVLQDSLKILVLDGNNTPLPRTPVYFSVIEPPTAVLSAPPVVKDPIQIEAEWGILAGTYSTKADDPGASGESYIVASAGAPQSGTATFRIYIEKDTTYWFWGRLISTNFWNSVLFFKVDGMDMWVWHSLTNRYSDAWQWDRVNNGGGPPVSMRLNKGTHTITVIKGHTDVKVDKILITYKSSYIPSGKNFVDQLFTNDNGIASTKMTLGTKAGPNRILGRAFGIPDTVIFYETARAANPVSMIKTNDAQTGAARDTLKLPFTVTLYDQYNNAVPNVVVTFTVTAGDGKVLASKDTTDNTGKAFTRFVLGIQAAENKVRATFTGYAGLPVEFTATASSGLVKKVQAVKVTTFPGKHYIGQVLPDFLKVKVLDDKDKPVANVGVTFQVSKGPATVGVQPKKTDALGFAVDTLKLGNTAGIARVVAKVGAVQDTVVRDSVYYKGAYLDFYGGTGQTGTVGDTLLFRLKVKVTNSKNEAVASHPVSFVTKGNGFHFPDGSDSVSVSTNISGIAQTNVRLGPVHGVYANIVVAKSTDGFFPIKPKNPNNSPSFMIYAKSNAAKLIKIAGDSLEGVVRGTLTTPLTVRMVSSDNKPVAEQPVDWIIKSGGGQFEGTLIPNLRVMTDGDGYARVIYALGAASGVYNNIVEASATNGISVLYGSPAVFHLTAKSSAADSIAAVTSKKLSGIAGKPLPTQIQVMLLDRHNNPISGAEVKFSVVKGGGALGGTADTTKTVTINNAAGIASIVWTLGTKAGTDNNILDAFASNGILALRGAPVRFTASGVPDSVSASKSTISASTPVMATEKDTCWITVTLLDAYGNPVSGKRVRLEVTGGERNFKYDPTLPTDAQGRARGYLQSLSAGEKQIRAVDIDDNIRLNTVTQVIFTPDGAYKMQAFSGSGQTGNAGTTLRDSLVVKIMDKYDNPVAYGPVKFDVIGQGRILGPQTVYSDIGGLAHTHLVLGPNAGENVVKVTAQVLFGSPVFFSATGKQGSPVAMRMISGSGQRGPAGEVLPNPFIAQVVDKDLNPVFGVDVQYKITIGKGSIVTSPLSKTDEHGYAMCSFKPDTIAGNTTWIEAINATLSGSPIRFSATSTAGTAKKIRYLSGNNQSVFVNETVRNSLTVKITDAYGNGVIGVSVQFNIVSGDATLQGGTSITVVSDGGGFASVLPKAGLVAGPIKIEAVNPMLQGSPVIFTLRSTAVQATSIEKFRGDNQKGRLGQSLVEPLSVRVLDVSGVNGVPGISVYFTKDQGGGSIVDPQPVVSDSNGVASIRFIAANTPGQSVVSALWSDKVVTFTVQSVVDFSVPVLDKSLIADSYDVTEGSELIIPMVASDADGNALTFQIANLFPPRGALVQAMSSSTAVFRWTPGFDQSGIYKVILRVIDGYGGADQDSVKINVLNVDRPPERIAVFPTHADTTTFAGKPVTFWVNYRDPDGDVLHYVWKVDGVIKGNDSPTFQYLEDINFNGKRTVDVFISDGTVQVSYRWLVTKVTMSAMAARFDQNNMSVTLYWSTSHEIYNIGFDVLRGPSEKGQYQKINTDLITSKKDGQYVFTDASVQAGRTYFYKIVDMDAYGNRNENGPLSVHIPNPDKFTLMQNYPNPFNPTTAIRYNVAKKEKIRLSVYNMIGQRVAVLVDQNQEPGFYTVQWDGRDEMGRQTATGVYLYRLESESQILVLRMVKLQ